jgi:hypothetical protein
MTDRTDETPGAAAEPRDAHELSEAVSELGDSPEDRLETVAERNESLEERLPSADDLPRTKGAPGQG